MSQMTYIKQRYSVVWISLVKEKVYQIMKAHLKITNRTGGVQRRQRDNNVDSLKGSPGLDKL